MNNKLKSIVFSISFILLIALLKSNVFADAINNGELVEPNKIWTITFNQEIRLDYSTINAIKVLNSKGFSESINIELSNDRKSLIIKPDEKGYTRGETYKLIIGKGVKTINNKNLKEEMIIEFTIIKEVLSVGTSFNNVKNRHQIIQSGNFIYHVNFQEKNNIYRMQKDGSNNELFYKGQGNISELNVANEYLIFVDNDPDSSENAQRICAIRKDGTGIEKVLYKNIYNTCTIQVVGSDIYFTDNFNLYKGAVNGSTPKRILNKIENYSDNISFLVKDGWIYYWGINYYTNEYTALYKITTDGKAKQKLCNDKILNEKLNIDGSNLYYINDSKEIYSVGVYGENNTRVCSDSNVHSINVYNKNIYYTTDDGIYKIRTNGTEKEKIVSINYNRDLEICDGLNIINEKLYYYDEANKLSSISLDKKENSSESISLNKGDTFYVDGKNVVGSVIIDYTEADVNRDGKKENIILTGKLDRYAYNNLKLFIQNKSDGEILECDYVYSGTVEEAGNQIILGDFNGDRIQDISINLLTNQQRGTHNTIIFSMKNNTLSKIFDENSVPSVGEDFKYEFLNGCKLKVYSDKFSYCYIVDLSSNEVLKNSKDFTIGGVGLTTFFEYEDMDNDGVLELNRNVYLVGTSYSDFLCLVKTSYKYNNTTNQWENVGFSVVSEGYPIISSNK